MSELFYRVWSPTRGYWDDYYCGWSEVPARATNYSTRGGAKIDRDFVRRRNCPDAIVLTVRTRRVKRKVAGEWIAEQHGVQDRLDAHGHPVATVKLDDFDNAFYWRVVSWVDHEPTLVVRGQSSTRDAARVAADTELRARGWRLR